MIDLGPDDPGARRVLETALVNAGLAPLDEPVAKALAGQGAENDAIQLAAAMSDAQQKFGALDCKGTITAAKKALPLLAERQAAELAVPELPRAWAYLMLCADRGGDADLAVRAAAMLRVVGAAPEIVPPDLMAKYPEVDVVPNVDNVEVDIETDVPGAIVWLDYAKLGPAPMHLALPPGDHVLAASSGARRGFLVGRPVKKQPKLVIEMADQAGPLAEVAAKVASWKGTVPSADELDAVMQKVKVRAAFVRHDKVVEVWGHAGENEPLRRLGGDDGVRSLEDAKAAASLLADRVEGWSSHAPDPDQPLLVESPEERASHGKKAGEEPTKWWVYATIGAAVVAGGIVLFAHGQNNDTQEIKLHYP
ncbi:MAG TPA: hypothetical protein VGC41_14235 [Kofleriaceae bacterium]